MGWTWSMRSSWLSSRRGFCRAEGGHAHGIEDLSVAAATAEVARQGLPDLLSRRPRVAIDQGLGGEQDSGRAVAALRRPQLGERLLQGMQLGAIGQPLHGENLPAPAGDGEEEAGPLRPAVDEHRTGAALAPLAAVLRPGEAEVLAEDLEERLVHGGGGLPRLAVGLGGNQLPFCGPLT